MLLDRLMEACTRLLPDAKVIVHGSLALGGYQAGKSDIDLLVVSDAPTDGLVGAVEQAWRKEPGEFDLRVVRYPVAAQPTRTPHLTLGISNYGDDRIEVERDTEEPDLVVWFSVCRQLGHTNVIGPVPDEWVDEVGAAVLARWKEGRERPHHELMALTACRIWRFREERIHCTKPEAAEWARERGAHVAYDEAAVRTLLDRASG
jgi:streptomycin 3"-adenylyltransferase